jgi:asparagine synthase (glutamine-hydrolysing)
MSEEPFIDIVVKGNNMKNYKMNFDARHVIDNFNLVLRHQDEPFFNLSVLAGYSILKAVKDKTSIVVLLNGQGGDELLMGYLKYFFFYERDMIKRGEYVKAVTLLLSAIYNRTIFNQFSLGKAKRYIPGLLTKGNPYIIDSGIDFVDTWSFDDMRHRQILDIDKFSIPGLCRYEDRNSTANSLEMRIPFLDFRLVSFCLNLRSEFKIKNGWTKYILRKVMNDLPSSISFRKDKKGFTVPEENFLRNELRSDILQIKDSSFLDDLGIINKREFANYYSRFLSGKGQSTEFTDVTRVYIAEQWAKNHFN